ncbi:hypothetical protein Vretimale_12112, partial [Volvox reticuliferus]
LPCGAAAMWFHLHAAPQACGAAAARMVQLPHGAGAVQFHWHAVQLQCVASGMRWCHLHACNTGAIARDAGVRSPPLQSSPPCIERPRAPLAPSRAACALHLTDGVLLFSWHNRSFPILNAAGHTPDTVPSQASTLGLTGFMCILL